MIDEDGSCRYRRKEYGRELCSFVGGKFDIPSTIRLFANARMVIGPPWRRSSTRCSAPQARPWWSSCRLFSRRSTSIELPLAWSSPTGCCPFRAAIVRTRLYSTSRIAADS